MHATLPTGINALPPPHRWRRWVIALILGLILLAVCAAALGWVAFRLETDIQKSIRPLPTTDHPVGQPP